MIGLAVTREGIPVRVWVWPGNTNDQTVIEQVKDDLRGWRLGRCVWVVDRGFSSAANLRYLTRGGGHWIGPAVKPAGSFHASVVGSPDSPGFCQYVCQPFSILSRNATVNGIPGVSAVVAGTSSASTCAVRTGAAAAAPETAIAATSTRAMQRNERTMDGCADGTPAAAWVALAGRGSRLRYDSTSPARGLAAREIAIGA